MSALTDTEWMLKSENSIKYIVTIKDFGEKIQTLEPGRSIHSRIFHIGESSFQIQIYPSGHTEQHRYSVGVFLMNRSAWRVRAECHFSLEEYSKILSVSYFQPNGESGNDLGFPSFVPHSRCTRSDLLSEDGTFTLEANIKLIQEEVTVSRNVTGVPGDLQAAIQSALTASLGHLRTPDSSQSFPPTTECPVCMETLRPPMRLMHCAHGHIVCDDCFRKSREEARVQRDMEAGRREGNPDMDRCHTCKGKVMGRPSELERILGLNK